MEFTNFLSLIKQQFDLVTIIKGLHAVRSFIIISMGFIIIIIIIIISTGFFNEIDDDDDDDDDDEEDIDDEDNNPNFYRHDVGNDDFHTPNWPFPLNYTYTKLTDNNRSKAN